MKKPLPKIAIVGRPNVGKSTFFNRLVGKKLAIVHNTPGVTRDWQEGPANFFGLEFTAIDTAGLEHAKGNELSQRMSAQSMQALDLADVIFFTVDGKAGLQAEDQKLAQMLRKYDKPIFLIINKCENKTEGDFSEFHRMGFNPVIPISAAHGQGIDEVAAYLQDFIPQTAIPVIAEEPIEDAKPSKNKRRSQRQEAEAKKAQNPDAEEFKSDGPLKLAIVGKPNAGKSTLINCLVGKDRLLTGPEAGITRDAIAVPFDWKGHKMELVDTAGLRKKSKVVDTLEQMATADTIFALNMAEVVVVVLDVSQGITKQDLTIADLAANEGRSVVIVINKWDLIRDQGETRNSVQAIVDKSLPQIKDVPILYVSALQNKGLDKILKAVLDLHKVWNIRVPTGKFNNWLKKTVEAYQPPMVKGRRLKLRYGTQIKTRPPTFVLFTNTQYDMPDSYMRYVVNRLREDFNMPGVPIRMYLRQGDNPYDKD